MRAYTLKEKATITAGAVAALVIAGWLVMLGDSVSIGAVKRGRQRKRLYLIGSA